MSRIGVRFFGAKRTLMKLTNSLLVASVVSSVVALAPSVADAQPGGYYSQPPPGSVLPGGFHNRTNRMIFGFSLGLGSMQDRGDNPPCDERDYGCSPIAGQASFHLGGFIGPRLALMGEIHGNAQTVDVDEFGDTTSVVQAGLLFAAQYWVTPQFWVKGGIGFSRLQLDHSYFGVVEEVPENGLALLAGAGFEVLSAQRFSVDIQGRIMHGSYDYINNSITGFSVGVGINWF